VKSVPNIDLSELSFLEYGDRTLIAAELSKDGKKVSPQYVSEVCKGKHLNGSLARRILGRAFEKAVANKAKLPLQALKQA